MTATPLTTTDLYDRPLSTLAVSSPIVSTTDPVVVPDRSSFETLHRPSVEVTSSRVPIVITAGYDGYLRAWDTESGPLLTLSPSPPHPTLSVSSSFQGSS
jgi:hypothetical protein